jgi:hypothetical protein
MMMQIKIQCGCGQHYAFEVEADGDLQPETVSCPVCGADGTAAANAAIAQSLTAQPTEAAAAPAGRPPRIRIATPPPAAQPVTPAATPALSSRPHGATTPAREINRTQLEFEARAKILWGDQPEEVIRFLRIQGLDSEEASAIVHAMFRERMATIRAAGISKMLKGIGMAIGSVVTFVLFVKAGFISIWILGSIAIACLYGLWLVLTGGLKVLAPKSEAGDAAEND